MKILVLSDTHGHSGPMLELVHSLNNLDACIFLGDGDRDADALAEAVPALPLYRVRGNCDFASNDPESGLAPFGGVLIYYTHGHALGVKLQLDSLWQQARACGADVALYGHTHAPYYELRDGIHLFNPGSLTMPRAKGASYGVITIKNGRPSFKIHWYTGAMR